MKIYDDEEFSVFRASPFEFSACFRAVAALPRNFLWLDMTRRAGMHRFIELSSKSNIGGWVIGAADWVIHFYWFEGGFPVITFIPVVRF